MQREENDQIKPKMDSWDYNNWYLDTTEHVGINSDVFIIEDGYLGIREIAFADYLKSTIRIRRYGRDEHKWDNYAVRVKDEQTFWDEIVGEENIKDWNIIDTTT